MSKHTLGPWYAVHHDARQSDMQPEYWTIETLMLLTKSGIVADTLNCDSTISPDEMRANAQLLAAAPDLLGACRQLLRVETSGSRSASRLKCSYCSGNPCWGGCPVEAARVAVARAEGVGV